MRCSKHLRTVTAGKLYKLNSQKCLKTCLKRRRMMLSGSFGKAIKFKSVRSFMKITLQLEKLESFSFIPKLGLFGENFKAQHVRRRQKKFIYRYDPEKQANLRKNVKMNSTHLVKSRSNFKKMR